MLRADRTALFAGTLALIAGSALGQDSVSGTPGSTDALSSYNASFQRTRYVVDLAPITSSWSNGFSIAPIIKASADPDPLFDTQLIGAIAVSPDLTPITFGSPVDFALWTEAGPGINPSANTSPGTVSVAGFDHQFGIAFADLSSIATNTIGATVGMTSEPGRLYVTRTVGASSRFFVGGTDMSTLSLGAIDANGNMYLRVDSFNTSTSSAVLGDNIVRVHLGDRSSSINTPGSAGSVNFISDGAAASYLVNDSAVTLNTPSLLPEIGRASCRERV